MSPTHRETILYGDQAQILSRDEDHTHYRLPSPDGEVLLTATSGRRLLVHTGAIAPKTTRSTIGVQAMTLKGKHRLSAVQRYAAGSLTKENRYRTKNLPAAGALPLAEDYGEQLTMM